MGVRGTDRGGPPIAKSVEFSSVPGREGHHLLGQSLRKKNPFFAALFRILTLGIVVSKKVGSGLFMVKQFSNHTGNHWLHS